MTDRVCVIEGCDGPQRTRGWCSLHYARWRRHGDPQTVLLDRSLTPAQRFWPKVNKDGPLVPGMETACWLWTGAKWQSHSSDDFYGKMRKDGGGYWAAHRLSYLLDRGELPEPPLTVDHMCHTTLCVNPGHLRALSPEGQQQNRRGASRSSLSGVRGVTWHKGMGKWMVQAHLSGRNHYGGTFDRLEDAEQAAIDLRNSLHFH